MTAVMTTCSLAACLTAALLVLGLLGSSSSVEGTPMFYGNNMTERAGDPLLADIQHSRIWIDDFKQDSWPSWGYLQQYQVYIHTPLPSGTVPNLRLQIWTNNTSMNNYTLKWQALLTGYTAGRMYTLSSPDPSTPIEVTQYDRLGFTNEGTWMPVSYNLELDDAATASAAHRTYWRNMVDFNYVYPVLGDTIQVDNYALRGRFSIGVVLNNAPPTTATQVYCGNYLQPRTSSSGAPGVGYLDDSVTLASGKIVQFLFKLKDVTSPTTLYLLVWTPTDSSIASASLLWMKRVDIAVGPSKTYNVSLTDGPVVGASQRIGWMFVGSNPLYVSFDGAPQLYQMASIDTPPVTTQTYTTTGLGYPYVNSIGVVVEQNYNGGSGSGSTGGSTGASSGGSSGGSSGTGATTSGKNSQPGGNRNGLGDSQASVQSRAGSTTLHRHVHVFHTAVWYIITCWLTSLLSPLLITLT